MNNNFSGGEKSKHNYKMFLDSDDPLDKVVLEFIENGFLKVGFVQVKGNRRRFFKRIIPEFFSR